jgi:hypothetical protein
MAAEPRLKLTPGSALRALGLLAVAAFVALLVYGVITRSPDTTIDDALARKEAVDAPGFTLDVLTSARAGCARRRAQHAGHPSGRHGVPARVSPGVPQIRDPTNDTARRWGATGIPETFFISRRGAVVGHVIGTVTDQQLAGGVAAALSGRPRGADEGGEQRPTR